MGNGASYQRYCRICWYGGRCWRIASTGSFASATNWSGIIGAGILAFALQRYGRAPMIAETWYEIVGQGLLFIVAAWVVIFLFRLFFIAPFQVHREGDWYGKKFVYREPKLAFRVFVSPSDNNKVFKFTFPDAPPFAFIEYKYQLDGRSDFISFQMAGHPSNLLDMKSEKDKQYTGGGIGVNKKREMFMKTFMRSDATPFSVRVYIHSWDDTLASGAPPNVVRKDFEPARISKDFEPARWGP
jgi:hypothetical protein